MLHLYHENKNILQQTLKNRNGTFNNRTIEYV